MRHKIHRIYILPLFVLLCMTACRPRGILHSWEMRDVLVDLHKTDALIQISNMNLGYDEEKSIYYAQVLSKHGVTQAEFDSSLVWYTAHPQLFDKIYPRVIARLKAEESAFLALHEDELDLQPSREGPKDRLPERLSEEQAREQLDSLLWVSRKGYPHTWNPYPSHTPQIPFAAD